MLVYFNDSNSNDIGNLFVPKSIFSQGDLWLWGTNTYGQVGDNTTTSKSSPVQTVSAGVNWKQISGGQAYCAGIKTDGTLWLWGVQGYYPTLGDNTRTNRSSPVQTVAGGTNWKQVSTGYATTAAIKTDGTLWLWGKNTYDGHLGDNTTTDRSSPVQTVAGGTNWKQVYVGYGTPAAIKTDGTLWLWGSNGGGQIGDNTTTAYSSPVQTVSGGTNWKFVSTSYQHTAAIKTDGTLWIWGSNAYGQLGDNTTTSRSSPVQTVSGGTNWKQVSLGYFHTASIKTDGTLWTWGRGNFGQLGNNSNLNRSSPVQTVSAGTNWKSLSTSTPSNHTAAIKTDGTLWLWGSGGGGTLGNNATTNRSSPVQTVSGGTNWIMVATGSNFTSARKDN